MKDLITILLPTYNGQKYIKKMLDSIYLQDYRPIEVIISDDASEDNTIFVINDWLHAKKMDDISFKVIKNLENKGLSRNISIAANYIHGKYLFLADQDDLWEASKVSVQVDYLENNKDCVMCICDRSIINKNDKVICKSIFKYNHANLQKRDYKKVLNSPIQYSANCMCLRTEHIDAIFPIPSQICEHDTFITIMAAHYGKVGYVKRSLTLYRIHENNLSGQFALETNRNLFKAGLIIMNGLKRTKKREKIDPYIIKKELKKRFNEDIIVWSKRLYSGEIGNIYFKSIQYMYANRDKWKQLC